jgi:predicted lipoprotein with Yx(FWY)xxD motif
MKQKTAAWKAKAALIGVGVIAAVAVVAAACGGGTSNSDKTATAAAGAPAASNTPAAAADTPTSTAATTPEAGSTTAAGGATGEGETIQAMAAPASGLKDVSGAALTQYLTDEDGMTMYIFKNDVANSGKSAVPASIAANWPPVTTDGAPVAGTGIDASALGTFTGADGKTWVTYKGMPLYYYAGDSAAGDTKGEGLAGIWFAVGP